MSDIGYLYVLANSAMPNMVKIGKTTRTPKDRATELSSATGLPVPFIVIYEQLFDNCSVAERFVHTYLQAKGHRVSENREFFSAPVNEIIRAISSAPGAIDNEDDLTKNTENSSTTNVPLWKNLLEEANSINYGPIEALRDYKEAINLYNKTLNLGGLPAYSELGRMHQRGSGLSINIAKAMSYYKEGTRKGNIHCYWAMGMLYLMPPSHEENTTSFFDAAACFSEFHERKNNYIVDDLHLTAHQLHLIDYDCARVLRNWFGLGEKYPSIMDKIFFERSKNIEIQITELIDLCRKNNFDYQAYSAALDYTRSIDDLDKATPI